MASRDMAGKITKRIIIIIVIVMTIIIGGLGVLSLRSKELKGLKSLKKTEFKTVSPERKTIEKKISASGTVKADQAVDLKFQTSGLLAWVGVKEGDWVKKNQAIASLDKRELKMDLEKEMNDYLNERWDFEQTQGDYKTTKERSLVTDSIKRILEKAQFDLNNAVIDYEISNLTYKLATIYSPIDGLVTHIDTPIAGVNITPATAIFTIVDPQTIYFEAGVDEIDIAGASEGKPAFISLDAYPDEKIVSQITRVGFQAETTRGGGTVFPVRLQLPENQNLKFKLGMNGEVEITTARKENALVIPYSTVTIGEEKSYLYVLENGKKKKREIETGISDEENVEVIEGLGEEDEVIVK